MSTPPQPHPQQGAPELLAILWRYRQSLLWAALLCAVLGLVLGLLLPAEQRARALLVPPTAGQAQTLLPQALPPGLVKEGPATFAPGPDELFDRLHVELSALLGQAAEDAIRHRLNRVRLDTRQTIELVLQASARHEGLPAELEALLQEAAARAWHGLWREYQAVRQQRMAELRQELQRLLQEEALTYDARRRRLHDQLQVLEALLPLAATPQGQSDRLIWQRDPAEKNLFEEDFPPYLLDRDQLQRRAEQIRIQLEQLERAPDGAYHETIAQVRSRLHWYESLPLPAQAPDAAAALLRFEILPMAEPVSLLKRLLLFFAGGFMLGLLLRMAWALLQEGVAEGATGR